MKKLFVFLFDGFSDWEISYLTPEINKSDKFDLIYFSNNGNMVTSMGGLQVKPTVSMTSVDADSADMLILPGGTTWESGENSYISILVNEMLNKGKPVAAICAATAFLGQQGLLDNLKHTSNDINYLKAVAPDYKGDKHYTGNLATTGDNIITANGIAPIEFACEVFRKIELFDEASIEKWYQLFKNGIWSE
jgi:putative intracellular protease/amidase